MAQNRGSYLRADIQFAGEMWEMVTSSKRSWCFRDSRPKDERDRSTREENCQHKLEMLDSPLEARNFHWKWFENKKYHFLWICETFFNSLWRVKNLDYLVNCGGSVYSSDLEARKVVLSSFLILLCDDVESLIEFLNLQIGCTWEELEQVA